MNFISGENRDQTILLPESIEEYVAENNTVRVIDAYVRNLNLEEMGFAKPVPHDTGRPMYDPKDMLKLYIYGYMNRIRSSRRLEGETKRNLEVIWLLGKLSPDHKTIARFRHDNTRALKNVFCNFVQLCMRFELYGKELISIDGSKFKAVNSKDRNFTEKKLGNHVKRLEAKIEGYLHEMEVGDEEEDNAKREKSAKEIKDIVRGLTERKEKYQQYVQELKRTGETQKSMTDKDSRLMKGNGKMDVCYNVQTAVDGKNKMIVEFEVTNNAGDANQILPMSKKAQGILKTKELTVIADAGYNSVQDIVASMDRGINVHVAGTDFDICVPAAAQGDTITGHKDGRCVYFPDRNIVLCPMGKILYPSFYKKTNKRGTFNNPKGCKSCTCLCTKRILGRLHEVTMAEDNFSKEYNDKDLFIRQIRIKADKSIIRQRKSIVEHPFGTLKRSMDAGYCLTKGLRNVTGEFSLAFLAYNLKRAINILGCRKMIENIAF